MHQHDSFHPLPPSLPTSTTHIDRAMSNKPNNHDDDDDAELLSSPTPSQMETEKEEQQEQEEQEEEEEEEEAAAFMRHMQATGPLLEEVGREGGQGGRIVGGRERTSEKATYNLEERGMCDKRLFPRTLTHTLTQPHPRESRSIGDDEEGEADEGHGCFRPRPPARICSCRRQEEGEGGRERGREEEEEEEGEEEGWR